MEKIKLNVREREGKTPNLLRRESKLPATLYGPGEPSQSVQIDEKEFTRLPGAAYSHMIELDFGTGTPTNCVIRNVQRKAYTGKIMNVELYRVRLDRKISVTVPLKFIGTSEAVTLGAQLVEAYLEVDIECFPNDIPDAVEVDLTALKELDDAIHFSDLNVGEKVKILNPPDEVVAKAITPRTVAEPEAEAAPAAAEGAAGAPAAGTAAATTPAEGEKGEKGEK
jgi:large subunit ribosomal protein L25